MPLPLAPLLFAMGTLAVKGVAPSPAGANWRLLAPSIEYTTFQLPESSDSSDRTLHVVRIDPRTVMLEANLLPEGGERRTAGEWAEELGYVAVINAGMFKADGRNVGYARSGHTPQQGHWNAYRSALLARPADPKAPPARLVDLASSKEAKRDSPSRAPPEAGAYSVVIQNLRLIQAPGAGVWAESDRRWSEAAIAEDRSGRILFLFSRAPWSMAEWNRHVLALPLHIVRAMHAEGGPEASLTIRAPGLHLDLAGSYETGFREKDDNERQWPIPNVIGVKALKP